MIFKQLNIDVKKHRIRQIILMSFSKGQLVIVYKSY